MNRRVFIIALGGLAVFTGLQFSSKHNQIAIKAGAHIKKLPYDDEYWRHVLTPAQYSILRQGYTEPRFSSKYTKFDGVGAYHCIACKLELFSSDMKFDSRTGWPSFSDHIRGHLEAYTDFRALYPTIAYRCAQCGGHHGHLIMDGPLPTGQRWCNNGQALEFRPV